MSGYEQVLDVQADLRRWWLSERGQGYGRAFAESVREKEPQRGQVHHETLPSIEPALLSVAEPVYVSEDVMTVLEAARETFQAEPLLDEDVFCERGFALLPRGLERRDRHGKVTSDRAFSWQPFYEHGRTPWGATDGGKVEVAFSPLERLERPPVGLVVTLYSHRDDPSDYPWPEEDPGFWVPKLTMSHSTMWWFGRTPEQGLKTYEPRDIEALRSVWRDLQVFFRLAQQRIAVRGRELASRPARKRAKRQGIDDPYYTVITLRRHREGGGGETDVDWRHRWIVDGHWRNQWYPSLGAHRQIWIAPFVKGPEDKPLRVRDGRAWEFVR